MLISPIISEAIISYNAQTEVWLTQPERLDCIISENRKHIPNLDEEYIIDWSKRIFNEINKEAK